jgi:hypothetical protein
MREELVRLRETAEAGAAAALGLTELTVEGLTLVAGRLGIPLAAAVRHLGLAGGGPERPIGQRHSLLRSLAHTLGVNAVFVGLYQTAHARVRAGGRRRQEVTKWR